MHRILLLTLTTACLMAADATGKWAGTLHIPRPDGTEQTGPALLVLKQDGATLTGTAGPGEGERHDIQNGKAEDGNLTFEVASGDSTMKFALKQDGEAIKGTITREREGRKESARLELKREK